METTSGVGLPERFEIDESGGTFRILWAWPRLMAVPLILFSMAWDTFLVFWYYNAAVRDQPSEVEWLFLLFPIGHVAVGLVLPYAGAAFLVNKTIVDVSGLEITVAHRPLPFPGNRKIPVAHLRQFFCVERTRQKGSPAYTVMARLTSGREVTLISGLSTDREARFLEERLERRIGLVNQPVSGELPATPGR
jgi:hypothetical protein